MAGVLGSIIENGQLPADPEGLLPYLLEADGKFISTEGPTWDFKESWPHSYSDGYFHGLCRLVCAFANTQGGLIIFGVSDSLREGGKNRIQPNLDRFTQAFRQLTGEDFAYDFRRYSPDGLAPFEVLLVSPLEPNRLPLRFVTGSQFYGQQTIWVRQGSEVIAAEPRHIAQLYCRDRLGFEDGSSSIEGTLPPSPATIRTFVGRISTIDQIFRWMKLSDQPRTFLYGKGGSGKSTIAFQVAKVIRESGNGFLLEGDTPVETVMYLSAKQRQLNPDTQRQGPFSLNDFNDERSLYEAILTEGGSEYDVLDAVSLAELKQQIIELLNRRSCFIVIDDIDTLTTRGFEAGFEFLIGALWRAKKKSKILYTLRNAPSQAISNSIAVPGLEPGGEYESFVELACKQFGVPGPEAPCRDGQLEIISERRPLVVESIIALRRNADSYGRAIELFQQNGGDDVRDYVFRREWDAIRASSRGRELLTVLALYNGPIAYDDLVALMYDNAAILPDALAEVQEMFVQVEPRGDTSTYRLNELTRSFVKEAAKELDFYSALKSRVQKFVTNIYADDPKLNSLLRRVDRLLYSSRLHDDPAPARQAWLMLTAERHDDGVQEDPRYMAACGLAALYQRPPNLAEARTYFQNSFSMRHSPDIEYVREWFVAEQSSDAADFYTDKIYHLVLNSRGYSDDIRLEFRSRRAVVLYNLARSNFHVEPERSLERLIAAMKLHAKGYSATYASNSKQANLFQRNFTNTTFFLKTKLLNADRLEDMIGVLIDTLSDAEIKLDPLVEPIRELCLGLLQTRGIKDAARIAGKLQHFSKLLSAKSCWVDKTIGEQSARYCKDASDELVRRVASVRRAGAGS